MLEHDLLLGIVINDVQKKMDYCRHSTNLKFAWQGICGCDSSSSDTFGTLDNGEVNQWLFIDAQGHVIRAQARGLVAATSPEASGCGLHQR